MNLDCQPNSSKHQDEKLQSILRLTGHYALAGIRIGLVCQSLV